MATDVLNPTPPEGGRVSRYRSARKASMKQLRENQTVPEVPPTPPMPDMAEPKDAVKRSMSRYHRARSGTTNAQSAPPARTNPDQPPPVPVPVPELPRQAPPLERQSRRNRSQTVGAQAPPPSRGNASQYSRSNGTRRPTTSHRTEQSGRQRTNTDARSEAQKILAGEQARYERMRARQRAEQEAKEQAAEYERLKKEKEAQEAEAAERLKREQIAEDERRQQRKIAEEEQRRQHKIAEEEEDKRRQEIEREHAEKRARKQRLQKDRRPADIKAPTKVEYDAAMPISPPQSSTPTSAPNSAKKFGFFKRRKGDDGPMSPPSMNDMRPRTSHAPNQEMPSIKPGGGGIVPLNDAPVSAVNHGGRRVRIECGSSTISLPVTPTTSALQLIRSASTVMSEPIDPRASVMYEVFTKAGVRRPLRMYEHIRDVMNSWDADDQHSLVIVPSEIGADNELYVSFTPKQKPGDVSWWLYYSQKPHKWDKRWVTLKSDGQLVLAKNETGKESANVCHLSDFDVYRPTEENRKKKVKPPKKFCFAIKSQQKSSMFLTTSNFIHFFCVNHKEAADSFFSTVQTWRSWYLVNVMGEGQASKGEQKPADETKSNTGPLVDKPKEKSHMRSASQESHYILGTFNDLGLDFSDYNKPAEPQRPPRRRSNSFSEDRPLGAFGLTLPSAQEHSRSLHTRQLSVRKERPSRPPVAFRNPHDSGIGGQQPSTHRPSTSSNSQQSNRGETFNPNGLLGEQYAQRQNALQNPTPSRPSHDYQGDGGLNRAPSIRSTRSRRNSFDASALNRAVSVRGGAAKPKPLIDLTPQYKEPPQFQKKGKGYKPDHLGAGGLIDSATSPDNPFHIPPSQDWRARPVTSAGPGPGQQHHHQRQNPSINGGGMRSPGFPDRTKSLRNPGHGGGGVRSRASIDEDFNAFTGGGLLARSGSGWGAADRGHGVMSGNMARGPMLDLSERSKFAEGSMLRRVERERDGGFVNGVAQV